MQYNECNTDVVDKTVNSVIGGKSEFKRQALKNLFVQITSIGKKF